MNKALLTTAYFPPISYFSQVVKAETIIIEAHENFQKQSYRNRCYIAGPNGKQMLNIPVVRPGGNHTAIQKVKFFNDVNWKQQHWNSIITAYNSSPFLLYYEDEIKDVLFADYPTLWEMNLQLLKLMISILQIKTKIEITDSYIGNYGDRLDLRNSIHPKLKTESTFKPYIQVFDDRNGFISNLSILDLLFNLGPETRAYLE
jgi:hypothetical protein